MFGLNEHRKVSVIFVGDDFAGITFRDIFLKLGICNGFGRTMVCSREKQIEQYQGYDTIYPAHVKPWHLILIFRVVHTRLFCLVYVG